MRNLMLLLNSSNGDLTLKIRHLTASFACRAMHHPVVRDLVVIIHWIEILQSTMHQLLVIVVASVKTLAYCCGLEAWGVGRRETTCQLILNRWPEEGILLLWMAGGWPRKYLGTHIKGSLPHRIGFFFCFFFFILWSDLLWPNQRSILLLSAAGWSQSPSSVSISKAGKPQPIYITGWMNRINWGYTFTSSAYSPSQPTKEPIINLNKRHACESIFWVNFGGCVFYRRCSRGWLRISRLHDLIECY